MRAKGQGVLRYAAVSRVNVLNIDPRYNESGIGLRDASGVKIMLPIAHPAVRACVRRFDFDMFDMHRA